MKGTENLLIRLISDSSTRYIIPLYQRNYDWQEQQCRQLFDDLVTLHNASERTNHFFGSIVSRQQRLSSQEIYLIDGQQRITTISILLIALYKAANAGAIAYENEITLKKIWNKYLVDEYLQTERKVKLKPIKNDMAAFDALLFKEPKEYIEKSNVTRNYLLFYEWVTKSGLTAEQVLASIEKLLVIDIRLDESDDPQLIFESLNSTGLDLSEADKIRNYLLMSLQPQEQEYFYNEYWNKIEELTDYKPTMFIRDYLTIKTRVISKIENLYAIFKNYVKNNNLTRQELLADMLPYAEYNYKILHSKTDNEKLNRTLTHLSTIDSTIGQPFYIDFLKYATETSLSDAEIEQVFGLVENYWARRIICNAPTNALNKVFSTLHYDILRIIEKQRKIDQTKEINYYDVLVYFLLQKRGSAYFPTDNDIKENFPTRQIYYIPMSYKYFLFERMENTDNVEEMDVVRQMQDGTATIEHIMPQTLTSEWKRDLGDDAERIFEKYLHTFANLTLTGYNINYSNHSFTEKKNGYIDKKGNVVYGFKDSSYHLNNYLKECSQWTETEILERQGILIDRFFHIWPMPVTDFEAKELVERVSFDPEESDYLTGRYIYSFTYKGTSQKAGSWKEMLGTLCTMLYKEHSVILNQLCAENIYLHDHASGSVDYHKFADNCWIWLSNSTKEKMNIIKKIFTAINADYSDLEFELWPQAVVNVEGE